MRPLIKRQFTRRPRSTTRSAPRRSSAARPASLQAVTDSDGRVKLAGETWSARLAAGATTTVGPGEEVRVIAIHGATAIVSPVPTQPT